MIRVISNYEENSKKHSGCFGLFALIKHISIGR